MIVFAVVKSWRMQSIYAIMGVVDLIKIFKAVLVTLCVAMLNCLENRT